MYSEWIRRESTLFVLYNVGRDAFWNGFVQMLTKAIISDSKVCKAGNLPGEI